MPLKNIWITLIAMMFPMLVSAQTNPVLQANPTVNKNIENIEKVKYDPSTVRLTDVSYSRDLEGWKYHVSINNPKRENLRVSVFGQHHSNKYKRLSFFAMREDTAEKVFENLRFKKLKFVLERPVSETRYKTIDAKYIILPVLDATITDISVTSSPPYWSFAIQSNTTQPMKYGISIIEVEGSTNHGLANLKTPLLYPGRAFNKSDKTGYLKPGNKLRVTVRDIPTQHVITSREIDIQ